MKDLGKIALALVAAAAVFMAINALGAWGARHGA